MTRNTNLDSRNPNARRFSFSLDAWALTLAFALALLIWSGAIKHIPW